jgi:ribonuclease I
MMLPLPAVFSSTRWVPELRGPFALLLVLLSASQTHAQSLEYFSLQMRWLPGQCLVDPELAACEGLSLQNPQGRNLTLIGLRPMARPGSTQMKNCDPMARAFTTPTISPEDKVTTCSLPEVKLSANLRAELAALMPDIAECPERAFWSAYGACALLSPEHYFERAVSRAQDLQHSLLNIAVAGAMGQRISRQVLADAFEQQFGPETGRSLQLICAKSKQNSQSVLTELRVAINQLGSMRPLNDAALWYPQGAAFQDRCPAEFLVAEPGVEEPPIPQRDPFPQP